MTKREILELYGIEFQINIVKFKPNERGTIRKTFLGGGEMETYFDLSQTDPIRIQQDLLPILQLYIQGNPPLDLSLAEIGGIGNYAIIYIDGIMFYNYNNNEIIQSVPLIHFKTIAEAWRDFLLQTT